MRRRLILSYLAVLLSFSIFTYTFVLRTVYNMTCNNLITVSGQTISSAARELNSALAFAPNYILQLCINEQIQDTLRKHLNNSQATEKYDELQQETADVINQDEFLSNYMYTNRVVLSNIPFLVEITYRTADGCYIPVYYSSRQNQTIRKVYLPDEPWVKSLEERNGKFLWDSHSDSSNTYLRLSKAIYDTRDYNCILGSISLDFSYEHLATNILNKLRDQSGITAAIADRTTGECIGYRSVPLSNLKSYLLTDSEGALSDGSGFFFTRKLDNTNFCLIGIKSLHELQATYYKSSLTLFTAAAAALLFGTLLAFLLGHRISKPIANLSQTMKKVQDGNLDISVSTKEHGEIGELYDSFNYMIRMINQLIEENYVTRLNQKQSELNALQSQINTHFLYNTLDSINWLAKDYHAEDISYLVTNLSTLLRTSLNSGSTELTLERELTHAHSYINIQSVRFSGLFHVEEDLDISLNEDKVIKMLLQPLVENAILHSFSLPDSDPEENLLILRTQLEGDYILLEVCNNADPEALDKIYELLNEDQMELSENYGIKSIRKRLEIAYNGKAQYAYDMDACGMLHASIRIPRDYTMPGRNILPNTDSFNDQTINRR